MKYLRSCVAKATVFTLLLLFFNGAQAQTWRTYPGAMCKNRLPVFKMINGQPAASYIKNGEFVNTSTTKSADIICPIVRVNGLKYLSHVKIYLFQQSNAQVRCELRSISANLSTEARQVKVARRGAGFRELVFSPHVSYHLGNATIYCTLPPKIASRHNEEPTIIGYKVLENVQGKTL